MPCGHRLEGDPTVGAIGAAIRQDGRSGSAGHHLHLRAGPDQVSRLALGLRFILAYLDLCRALGDRIYPTLAKQEALEPILKAWQADPARVRPLCDWHWIREALMALPANTQAS